jgi:hypothetical protein
LRGNRQHQQPDQKRSDQQTHLFSLPQSIRDSFEQEFSYPRYPGTKSSMYESCRAGLLTLHGIAAGRSDVFSIHRVRTRAAPQLVPEGEVHRDEEFTSSAVAGRWRVVCRDAEVAAPRGLPLVVGLGRSGNVRTMATGTER